MKADVDLACVLETERRMDDIAILDRMVDIQERRVIAAGGEVHRGAGRNFNSIIQHFAFARRR